jgi:hypothetical protein
MTNLTHSFLMYLFHASTCFEHKCSSSGEPNCINTSSGITHSGGWLSGVPVKRKLYLEHVIPDNVWIHFGPPEDEHLSSKHVEAWNKYIKKECVKLVINQNSVLMCFSWREIFIRVSGLVSTGSVCSKSHLKCWHNEMFFIFYSS